MTQDAMQDVTPDAATTTPSEQARSDNAASRLSADDVHFLYFADPMCSWCYGFAPVIDTIANHFAGRIPVRVVVGGLRAGNTQAMRAADRDYISSAWTRVAAASGRTFDHAFFDREHFVYDTEPACRAVVTARTIAPDKALAMKAAISTAFYANNRDTTDRDVLLDIAADEGFDRAEFGRVFDLADTRNATTRDFHVAQQSGVQGFPCLVVGTEQSGYALVTNGFRPIDGLIEGVEGWLAQRPDAPQASW